LAAPGKLVANGSPVTLKTTLGEGYNIQVKFSRQFLLQAEQDISAYDLLPLIRRIAPEVSVMLSSHNQASYHLRSKDPIAVEKVLLLLDSVKSTFGVVSYDVLSTSIEDIFLQLMNPHEPQEVNHDDDTQSTSTAFSFGDQPSKLSIGSGDNLSLSTITPERETLTLATGEHRAPWNQALVIFLKRILIARRSWLAIILLVAIAIAGSTVPVFFMAGRPESCIPQVPILSSLPLYLPISPLNPASPINGHVTNDSSPILTHPPGITSELGITSVFLQTMNFADNTTFIDYVNQNYRNISLGGISFDFENNISLFAWETTLPGLIGSAMLNLVTNVLFNKALEASGNATPFQSLILANYQSFPFADVGFLGALKWSIFFGATMVGGLRSPPILH
jgi:ATP-binding cassette, subfamily A (ABC1), member 3